MKAVLMSIHQKYCELIFNGKKTIEVRTKEPMLETPFTVYVYCTKQKILGELVRCKSKELSELFGYGSLVGINKGFRQAEDDFLCGKVIGSFVCDKIEKIDFQAQCTATLSERWTFNRIAKQACLTVEQLEEYLSGNIGYGWRITEPKLFDEPRDITEFAVYARCAQECSEYDICMKYDSEETRMECPDFKKVPLKRAPQSWMYVEEM